MKARRSYQEIFGSEVLRPSSLKSALFTALLFAMGLLTRQEYFAGNFLNTLLLGQALNLFDFLVIDLLGGGTQNGCGFPAPRKVRNYMRTPANDFTLSCGEFFCFWLLL